MRPPEAETCAVGVENEGKLARTRPELCSVNWAEVGEQQQWVLGVQRARRAVPGVQRVRRAVPGATAGSCGSLALRPAQRAFGEKWI